MPHDSSLARSSGSLRFSIKSLERIVGTAIASVPGTVAIDAKLAGLAGRAFPRLLIQSDPTKEVVAVDANIAVTWPSPVTAVAEAARAAIEEAVRTYTGYATTRVNVTVAAAVPGERVTGLAVASRRAPSVTLPHTRPQRELQAIETTHLVQIRSVSRPEPQPVRAVSPRTAPVSVVSAATPQPAALTPVHSPKSAELRPVATPPALQLRRVDTPQPAPLRPVRTPQPATAWSPTLRPNATVRRPMAPRPEPLREITIQPLFRGGAHE
ncbi:Asp23/Gls24 family envelope stress response protein [Corynebacterium striatum]|uniref:Asp23/Gls24 family envelope stress response protein n=1 Tax=Corynebacterium striatum TaxID=43770 RepID=UPI001A1D308A|nr:Asp23/Gls24 family envelope stress response protein [Corynebacterium striatum]MDK8826790.1 Asp23/Gls24 family envelope stress response protein [Corynebacterium striatum]HAT1504362.1 Asp23/Gls24 family envelope stress response protein [Corynebacterium striatum]HAT1506886.1 Asp23/Gls24 family envelope stress response protein [Corynebacterium striatum]